MPNPIIAVVGSGGGVSQEAIIDADQVGRIAAEMGAIILTGGGSGVMRAASQAALDAGGRVIAVYKEGHDGDRRSITAPPKAIVESAQRISIYTAMDHGRNYLNAVLCDAMVALEGGPGTLSELTFALIANNQGFVRTGRPVICLNYWFGLAAVFSKETVELPNGNMNGITVPRGFIGCLGTSDSRATGGEAVEVALRSIGYQGNNLVHAGEGSFPNLHLLRPMKIEFEAWLVKP